VVINLGGSAQAKDVLGRIEKAMTDKFAPVDLKPLRSGQIRWRNTAQWARNELVSDGYLAKETPRGIWEITKKGEQFLNQS